MKEKIKKPKCKGVWKFERYGGVYYYICTKCKKRRSGRTRPLVDHIDM